jgi:hypothetical protein
MRQVAWMAGASVAGWLVASAIVGTTASLELFCGMLGPLLVACATWVMAERTYTRDPRALTGLMVAAFAFKLVFFGGYVAVMLRVVGLRLVPFAVSFSSYFIALHLVEALLFRRLFAGGSRA